MNGQAPVFVDPQRGAPPEQDLVSLSQGQLIWRRFKRHRLATVSMGVLGAFYLVALVCGFLSPYTPTERLGLADAFPTRVRIRVAGQGFSRPFVYGYTKDRNRETLQMEYRVDTSRRFALRLFVHGSEYRLMGLFRTDVHLFGVDAPGVLHLFGSDQLGRDLFSRVMYGTRISTTIGLLSIFLSLILGLLIGSVSALYGGVVDIVIQRIIEVILVIPSIPLWMGLAAALPKEWSAIAVYFAITVILALRNWIGVARVVRGKFLSLKAQDFVTAARAFGASNMRIIRRHLVPNFFSYVIVSVTLSLPATILGETALSFLGIGLRPPVVSWGVLLRDAQNVHSLAEYPWRMIPGLFVIVIVLAFNFVGDGIRDAADPYR